jgi:AcrR family transcriptional regulator
MPRSPEDNALLREQSRNMILSAAMRLFAEAGYERTTVRMIAREAGISQGLLYNYYAGKEDVLRALFMRSMEDVRRSFAAAHDAAPEQSVAAIIRASVAIVQEHFDFWRLSYNLRAQPNVLASLGDTLHAWTDEINHTLQTHLRAGGWTEPEIEAAILFATIDGVTQHYAANPRHYPLQAVVNAFVARYDAPPITKGGSHEHAP